MSLREEALALDAADPLSGFRERFRLRQGLIYLDGNSLGALPKATAARMAETVEREWGEGLITSWLGAGWQAAPRRVGDKIARLLGAEPGEVVIADSTSVNLFKALAAAISLRPDRPVIVSESGNFPTDLYMMQGIAAFSGGRVEVRAVAPEQVEQALDTDCSAVLLTQVHYKTGLVRDMAETTAAIQAAGALAIWDLSHSAGAIPVDLSGANADFAVGCGYKFLNGGPGAPAYIYAAERHHGATPVLSGWFGHAAPFDFTDDYRPAEGIERFLCGTPHVLGLAALEVGVDLMLEADIGQLREKSLALGWLLERAMAPVADEHGFELVSPADPARRGSQLSYAHPEAYAVVQALKELDVIADFRTPDVMRLGLTPLYLRFEDMVEAAERIGRVMRERSWDREQYRVRAAVT